MKPVIHPIITLVLFCTGGVLTFVCLTNPNSFNNSYLRYFVLFIGIASILMGVFLEYINWLTYTPLVKKTAIWILVFLLPFYAFLFYYVLSEN